MHERSILAQPSRVALVGNPNCGKTALFNALTGSRQKVANYPGVTVERKEGNFVTPQGRSIKLLDLPGTYSLRARSPDEEITREVVLGRIKDEELPEIILCVADASNLRLALRLALELRNIGRPMALVLNMIDIARHRGIEIDIERLSSELGIPVTTSVAVRRGGTDALLSFLDAQIARLPSTLPSPAAWSAPSGAEICALQHEADRIMALTVKAPPQQDTFSAKVDSVLLHPFWGILILLAVLFVMFQAVFTWSQLPMEAIKAGENILGHLASQMIPEGLAQSFVVDGLIHGVGAIVVFLPQILIVFLFILMLEDFGYMARAAFLMDKIMGAAGLHGRAFIPLLSSFACAIPAIMATRVIDNRRDRLTTILATPLMPCSARVPVYTLLIGAFVPDEKIWGGLQLQGMVMFGLYAAGILAALAVSFLFRRTLWKNVPSEPFLMELPDYKMPNFKSVLYGLLQRAMIFLRRAGTTIAAMMVVIWFLASYPRPPAQATAPAVEYSYAAHIGKAMEPFFAPLGFNWKINVALVPGMAAREVVVAALGTVYALEDKDGEAVLGQTLSHDWSLATALALLAWYAFAPQCASTLVMIRKETGSLKWMAFSFLYMLSLAYAAAFLTYRIALALGA
jgi:ferrous iron transport protein B